MLLTWAIFLGQELYLAFFFFLISTFNVCLFIYLAALGLSFATQDLGCMLIVENFKHAQK